jgi:hypothetical protein
MTGGAPPSLLHARSRNRNPLPSPCANPALLTTSTIAATLGAYGTSDLHE